MVGEGSRRGRELSSEQTLLRAKTLRAVAQAQRQEAAATLRWRLQKVKEWEIAELEAEEEATDRYRQNVNLLEEIFTGDARELRGLEWRGREGEDIQEAMTGGPSVGGGEGGEANANAEGEGERDREGEGEREGDGEEREKKGLALEAGLRIFTTGLTNATRRRERMRGIFKAGEGEEEETDMFGEGIKKTKNMFWKGGKRRRGVDGGDEAAKNLQKLATFESVIGKVGDVRGGEERASLAQMYKISSGSDISELLPCFPKGAGGEVREKATKHPDLLRNQQEEEGGRREGEGERKGAVEMGEKEVEGGGGEFLWRPLYRSGIWEIPILREKSQANWDLLKGGRGKFISL